MNFRLSETEYLDEEGKRYLILATSSYKDLKIAMMFIDEPFDIQSIQELKNIHNSIFFFNFIFWKYFFS